MELEQYLRLLWRWKWLILVAVVIGGCIGYFTSNMEPPIYQASTKVLINQAPAGRWSDYYSLVSSERLARTYVELFTTKPVLEDTMAKLGLEDTPEDWPSGVAVDTVSDTQFLVVTVRHRSPDWAATIANELVNVFAERNEAMQVGRYRSSEENLRAELERLQTQIRDTEDAIEALGTNVLEDDQRQLNRLYDDLNQYRQSYTSLLQSYEQLRIAKVQSVSTVEQVEVAVTPSAPIAPKPIRSASIGSIVGTVIVLGVIALKEYLDDTIRTPSEVTSALDLEVVGLITHFEREGRVGPHVANHPRSPTAEAFRALRTRIEFCSDDRDIRIILVTSPGPREGKSTVAANLAVTMAHSGKRVLLLDADLRRPNLHRLIGVPNRIGLGDLISNGHIEKRGSVIWKCKVENLYLMTSGTLPSNPAELLGSERMGEILEGAADKVDIVIIDTPPIGVVIDALVLAARADGVLVVVEPEQTPLGGCIQAVEQIRASGAHVIGVVFNNLSVRGGSYYNSYYSSYVYSYQRTYGEDGRKLKALSGLGKRKKQRSRGESPEGTAEPWLSTVQEAGKQAKRHSGSSQAGGICPYLGRVDDPESCFSFPSGVHKCYGTKKPVDVSTTIQASYCLAPKHVLCNDYIPSESGERRRASGEVRSN